MVSSAFGGLEGVFPWRAHPGKSCDVTGTVSASVAVPWAKLCQALSTPTAPDAGILAKPKTPVLPEVIACLGTRAPGRFPNPNGNFTQMTE